MDTSHDDQKEPRIPRVEDLVALCRKLNEVGAKYLLVDGMAMIQSGYDRSTGDIDLLIETTLENEAKVITALRSLPDQAAAELQPGEVAQHTVVRVADEIIVDLMKSACGISYDEAKLSVQYVDIDGVPIPIATPELLWRMKQTGREKDRLDLLFLRELLNK